NAVAAAGVGEEVLVSNGLYQTAATIVVGDGKRVRGFVPREQVVVDGQGLCRVFLLSMSSGAVLDGLTITNGYTTSGYGGGGVYIDAGTTVTNCVVVGNTCASPGYMGGGVVCGGLLVDSLIIGNVCSYRGGGVYLSGYGVAVGCTVVNNRCLNTDYAAGGGMCAGEGSPMIADCLVVSNESWEGGGIGLFSACVVNSSTVACNQAFSAGGGGIYTYGTAAQTIQNCVISSNTAAANGGGVEFVSPGVLSNCTVNGNVAGGAGGVLLHAGSAAVRCRIAGNQATGMGGGVYTFQGGYVESCEISGNQAGTYGGGVAANKAGVLQNCTVAGNQASQGGGRYVDYLDYWLQNGGFCPQMTNCIVALNEASSSPQLAQTNGVAYSCSPGLGEGVDGNTAADPKFLRNGTGAGLALAGEDFRLRRSSPCVDRGLNDLSWMDGAQDLNGCARIYPINGTVDMGCYEVGPPSGSVILFR
ncbi:MAG: right-handed parallel beta-helix repeat-containing protein, partial [Kiritimatiellae bacterium]|nr:right-handed parallel beta-helix repeat-containing protein [Kiritimatiellia bacterium]